MPVPGTRSTRAAIGLDRARWYCLLVCLAQAIALTLTFRSAIGPLRWIIVGASVVVAVLALVALLHDTLDRTRMEGRLSHLAFHDPLTGLANRALFLDRLRLALARAARDDSAVAVLFIDLDDFKSINDSLGHAAGDTVLVAAAERLRSCLRQVDTAARLGGDELAALLESPGSIEDVTVIAERILVALRAPLRVAGREVFISASIGIATNTSRGDDVEELLAAADLAMYEAKHRGKNCAALADPQARARVHGRMELQTDLRMALERGELSLLYRPVVSLTSRGLAGVEGVLRWNHPRRRVMTSSEILAVAESIGAIHAIGAWALREGCRQMATWATAFPEQPLQLTMKLTTAQLRRDDLVSGVAAVLAETGLEPRRLVLELMGTAAIREGDDELPVRIHALKKLGARLSINGVGTGRASLAVLPGLALNMLKVDKLFVDGVGSPGEGALAFALAMLGHILKLEVIAEGVETAEQADTLTFHGCDLAQGRYFGSPCTAQELETRLLQHRDKEAGVAQVTSSAQ